MAAATGDLRAINAMGVMYESGHGVEKNMEQALKCYETAATRGNALAQSSLGIAYLTGKRSEAGSG